MIIKNILSSLLIAIIIIGCDSIPNDVIDVETSSYILEKVTAPDYFIYKESDSLFSQTLMLQNARSVQEVSFELINFRGTKITEGKFEQQGDPSIVNKTFVSNFPMSKNYINGNYEIHYFVSDLLNGTTSIKKVAAHQFYYNNGQSNEPPVISELLFHYRDSEKGILDTVETELSVAMSVQVNDPNGLNDINKVYYQLFDPDSNRISNSEGRFDFPLFDDGGKGEAGDTGDEVAGDGRYTTLLKFPNSVKKGSWKFEFRAEDYSEEVSNLIIHNVVVK